LEEAIDMLQDRLQNECTILSKLQEVVKETERGRERKCYKPQHHNVYYNTFSLLDRIWCVNGTSYRERTRESGMWNWLNVVSDGWLGFFNNDESLDFPTVGCLFVQQLQLFRLHLYNQFLFDNKQ
jgi:hypothetical protein